MDMEARSAALVIHKPVQLTYLRKSSIVSYKNDRTTFTLWRKKNEIDLRCHVCYDSRFYKPTNVHSRFSPTGSLKAGL